MMNRIICWFPGKKYLLIIVKIITVISLLNGQNGAPESVSSYLLHPEFVAIPAGSFTMGADIDPEYIVAGDKKHGGASLSRMNTPGEKLISVKLLKFQSMKLPMLSSNNLIPPTISGGEDSWIFLPLTMKPLFM